MADARLMVAVVRAPEGVELAEQVRLLVGELGGAEEIDRVGARLLPDLEHLVADFVDRLVPTDAGPSAGDELHRVLQAPVAVRMLAGCRAFGAVCAEVERAVPARLLADPYAVLHFGNDRAADRAVRAHRLPDLDLAAAGGGCGRFGLLYSARGQRRCGGETADGEAGITQERAGVDRCGRRLAQRRRETYRLGGSVRLL